MKNEKRTIVKKFCLSPTEAKAFDKNFQKSGTGNESEFIRLKTISTNKQQVRQLRMASKQEQEQKQKCKMIVSGLCSTINKIKAGVDIQTAIVDLEQEVNELCHALR